MSKILNYLSSSTIQNQLNDEIKAHKKMAAKLLVKMTGDHHSKLIEPFILLEKEPRNFWIRSGVDHVQDFSYIGRILTGTSIVEYCHEYAAIPCFNKIVCRLTLDRKTYGIFSKIRHSDFDAEYNLSYEYISLMKDYERLLKIKQAILGQIDKNDPFLETLEGV